MNKKLMESTDNPVSDYEKAVVELAELNDKVEHQNGVFLPNLFTEMFETDGDFSVVWKLQSTDYEDLIHIITESGVEYCLDNQDAYEASDDDEKEVIDKAVEVFNNFGVDAIIDALLIGVGRKDEVNERWESENAEEDYDYDEPNEINYEYVWNMSHPEN